MRHHLLCKRRRLHNTSNCFRDDISICGHLLYHGQLRSEEEEEAADLWKQGEVLIMIATSAFAVGINKRDVRFVIEAKLPSSMMDLLQESGRAGRDNDLARCFAIQESGSLKQAELSSQTLMRQWMHDCASRALSRLYILTRRSSHATYAHKMLLKLVWPMRKGQLSTFAVS
ncbi:P-loop containing nucleoside triphosphate hydrolase protein [Phlyctochytrium arcticum]|nr:P-loop containing nucleoside triphosphate hydrolase protein [Phlyctochytrium arcticum]